MANVLTLRDRTSVSPTRARIYASLRDSIVRAELEPGRRLSENELATRFGVSRTPVREALARFRDERLAEVVPQLGTFVSRISPSAVADAQFLRDALECAAVRKTAERASRAELVELELNLRAQRRITEAEDHDAFYVLDDAFHKALCDCSGHGVVWSICDRAKSHLNRIRRLSLPLGGYLEAMREEHRTVLGPVADRDPDAPEDALRYHARMVLRELPQLRSEHPSYFEDIGA